MNRTRLIVRTFGIGVLAVLCGIAFNGCQYDVPITAKPTGKIDARLLGDWVSKDGKDKMKVVKMDDWNYVVYSGGSLYRAYESDVAGAPFVTVQILTTDTSAPTYAYWTCSLSGKGTLTLKNVSDKIVPDSTKSSMNVRRILRENLKNPELFSPGSEWVKDKQQD